MHPPFGTLKILLYKDLSSATYKNSCQFLNNLCWSTVGLTDGCKRTMLLKKRPDSFVTHAIWLARMYVAWRVTRVLKPTLSESRR